MIHSPTRHSHTQRGFMVMVSPQILAYGHTGSGKTYTMMGDGTSPGEGIVRPL